MVDDKVFTTRSQFCSRVLTVMKVLVCIVLALACVSAGTVGPLAEDFADFQKLVPTDEIVLIAGEHLLFDSKFRKAKDYLEGSAFKKFWAEAIKSPQFYAILEYLGASGIDAVAGLDAMAKKLKLADYDGPVPTVTERSFSSFLNDVANAFPKSKIQALIKSKIASSPAFAYFYERITSPAFNVLIQNFLVSIAC